jgi:predicted ABC-type ATPase
MAGKRPAVPVKRPKKNQRSKPAGPVANRPGARARAERPVLLVLAGVNGAGKSSIGGDVMLRRSGLTWFNPDAYSRLLVEQTGLAWDEANALAWQHGLDLFDRAVAAGHSHAFETTLGGATMAQRIAAASGTHDVLMWYCGLSSAEQHIARVAKRVLAGGHAIAEAKIRERWVQAPLHLIALMPHLNELRVFDNSAEAEAGQAVEDPRLVLHALRAVVQFPLALEDLQRTPAWAKPIVKAARDLARDR